MPPAPRTLEYAPAIDMSGPGLLSALWFDIVLPIPLSLSPSVLIKEDGKARLPMTPIEAPVTSPIIHYDTANKPPVPKRPYTNPNLLSPDAAFYAHVPPARQQTLESDHFSQEDRDTVDGDTLSLGRGSKSRRRRRKDGVRSGGRRGKPVWKKLLWVKQRDCPYLCCNRIRKRLINEGQIPIITPIPLHSSRTYNSTLDYARTISGPW